MRNKKKFAEALRFFVPTATHALRSCHARDVQGSCERVPLTMSLAAGAAGWAELGCLRKGQRHPRVLMAIACCWENLSICFVVTSCRRISLNSYVRPARDGAPPDSFVLLGVLCATRLRLSEGSDQ